MRKLIVSALVLVSVAVAASVSVQPAEARSLNVTATANSQSSITVTWNDNYLCDFYTIYRNGSLWQQVYGNCGTTQTLTDTGRSCGTSYSYSITDNDDSSTGSASATTDGCMPGAPSGVSASESNHQITIRWTRNSPYTETGFTVGRTSDSACYAPLLGAAAAGATSFTFTSDYCGDSTTCHWQYGVAATLTVSGRTYVSATGLTGWTTVDPCTPGTPTNRSATAVNQTDVQIGWSPSSPYTQTGFKVVQYSASPPECFPETGCCGSNPSQTSATLTGYACGTTVTLSSQVYACLDVDGGGAKAPYLSSALSYSPLKVYPDACTPAVPTNVTATPQNQTQVQYTWSDNSSNETGFQVFDGNESYTIEATLGANVTSYTDTFSCGVWATQYMVRSYVLTNGRYYYSSWSSYSNAVQTDACTPGAPTNVSLSATDQSSYSLSWTRNSPYTESNFGIFHDAGSGSTDSSPDYWANAGATSYPISGLGCGYTMRYLVNSHLIGGSGSIYWGGGNWSNWATTDACSPTTPTNLTATAISSTQINLAWTDASGESGYDVWRCLTSSCSYSYIGYASANQTSYSDTGLTPSTGYTYRLHAYVYTNGRYYYAPYSGTAAATTLSGNHAPTCSTLSSSANENTSITLSQNCSDSDGDTLSYSWWNNGSCNSTAQSTASSWTVSQTEPLVASYSYRAYDGAAPSTCTSISATWNNVAPSVSVTNNGPVIAGSAITYTANASDPGGTTFSYQWYSDACSTAISGATGSTYQETLGSAGTRTRYVRACDAQSSCTCSAGSTGTWNSSISAPSGITSLSGVEIRGWPTASLSWSGSANGFLVYRKVSGGSYSLYADRGSPNASVGTLTCPGSYVFKVVSYNTDASVTSIDSTCSAAGVDATTGVGKRCGTLVETSTIKLKSCAEHHF
jgi:hypothetical protein